MKRPTPILPILFVFMSLLAFGCQKQGGDLVGPVNQAPAPRTPSGQAAATPAPLPAPMAVPAATDVAGWIRLGNGQMDAQRYAEAIIAYQKALDLDPKNVDVRVDMGTCYRGVGQPERAITEYAKALVMNPRHANANRNMGVVLAYDLGRPAEAALAFQKYLEVYPGAPDKADILSQIATLRAKK